MRITSDHWDALSRLFYRSVAFARTQVTLSLTCKENSKRIQGSPVRQKLLYFCRDTVQRQPVQFRPFHHLYKNSKVQCWYQLQNICVAKSEMKSKHPLSYNKNLHMCILQWVTWTYINCWWLEMVDYTTISKINYVRTIAWWFIFWRNDVKGKWQHIFSLH